MITTPPELLARSLLAATPVRGRAVPELDPKSAPPEARPAYPRIVTLTIGKPHPRDRFAATPELRAQAARYRARVALAARERREARLTARRADRGGQG